MEGKLTLARLDSVCIMEGTADGKGPRALDLRKGSRMASKNNLKRADAIITDYVDREREKMDRELVTSNAYDYFVRTARFIDPDITDEKLDDIYSTNFDTGKYANAVARWFDDNKYLDDVIKNAATILDAMDDVMTSLSRTDIFIKAGFKKPRYDNDFDIRERRAFDILNDAGLFRVTPVCTCGHVHIYLYALK